MLATQGSVYSIRPATTAPSQQATQKKTLWRVQAVQAETNRPRPSQSTQAMSLQVLRARFRAHDAPTRHRRRPGAPVRQGRCDGMPAPQLHSVRVRPGKLLSYQDARCTHATRPCGHRPDPRDACDPTSGDSDLAYTCSRHWQPEGRDPGSSHWKFRRVTCTEDRDRRLRSPGHTRGHDAPCYCSCQRPTLAISESMRASVVASNGAGVQFQLCPACPSESPPSQEVCTWAAPLDLLKSAPRALLVSSLLFFLSG